METNSADDYGQAPTSYLPESDIRHQVNGDANQQLEVIVIFTEVPATLAALQEANALAKELAAHLQLLVAYEVPYTLPLWKPAVRVEFLERQIRDLAFKSGLEVAVQSYLCRDKRRALEHLLRPHALIVLGSRKRWWPTRSQRLAGALKRSGHHVIHSELR